MIPPIPKWLKWVDGRDLGNGSPFGGSRNSRECPWCFSPPSGLLELDSTYAEVECILCTGFRGVGGDGILRVSGPSWWMGILHGGDLGGLSR